MSDKGREEARERLEEAVLEYRFLQDLGSDLKRRLDLILATLTGLGLSSSSLEEVKRRGKDAEILIPIGSLSYVKAKVVDADRVLVGLGSNVVIERSIEEARKYFEERSKDLERAVTELQRQIASVQSRLNELEPKIRQLIEAERSK
ncbi:MAG: prefoldin subunit alpha [Candidatus Nezhaarchaeales archaeon]